MCEDAVDSLRAEIMFLATFNYNCTVSYAEMREPSITVSIWWN